jgi:hypothetical protein
MNNQCSNVQTRVFVVIFLKLKIKICNSAMADNAQQYHQFFIEIS